MAARHNADSSPVEGDDDNGKQKQLGLMDEADKRQFIALAVFITICIILGLTLGNDTFGDLTQFKAWFLDNSPWSAIIYIAVFTVAVFFFVPMSPLSVAVGFIYGWFYGALIQTVASTVAGFLLFMFGRTFLHSWVSGLVRHDKVLSRLHSKLGDPNVASELNLLLCFTPMPFALHVHLFAVTSFAPGLFLLTFIPGLIPWHIVFAVTGQALYEFGKKGEGELENNEALALGVGLLASIVCILYCMKIVQEVLRGLDQGTGEPDESSNLIGEDEVRI